MAEESVTLKIEQQKFSNPKEQRKKRKTKQNTKKVKKIPENTSKYDIKCSNRYVIRFPEGEGREKRVGKKYLKK